MANYHFKFMAINFKWALILPDKHTITQCTRSPSVLCDNLSPSSPLAIRRDLQTLTMSAHQVALVTTYPAFPHVTVEKRFMPVTTSNIVPVFLPSPAIINFSTYQIISISLQNAVIFPSLKTALKREEILTHATT